MLECDMQFEVLRSVYGYALVMSKRRERLCLRFGTNLDHGISIRSGLEWKAFYASRDGGGNVDDGSSSIGLHGTSTSPCSIR